jgi:bifunctional non-homologous end joining protein LigD
MTTQNYTEFKNANRSRRANADIDQRWQTRVIALGLHGHDGGMDYLAQFGRTMAAPKAIKFANKAEREGDLEMAEVFWAKAFVLTNHLPVTVDELISIERNVQANDQRARQVPVTPVPATIPPAQSAADAEAIEKINRAFPKEIQPGSFVTMQPEDARCDRQHYIDTPKYWGWPKRDGVKCLVFASATGVFKTQSRQMKVNGAPSVSFQRACARVARQLGSYIVEGELYYLDFDGREHRTAAQALTANQALGHPEAKPQMRYAIFDCLLFHGQSMLERPMSVRVSHALSIAQALHECCEVFEVLPLASRRDEKDSLAQTQKAEGREGEIWFDATALYHHGKDKSDSIVRTKYVTEFEAFLVNLTQTTAENHAFGAMEIASLDGKPLGAIGTGFTLDEKREIHRRYQEYLARPERGMLKVRITSRGYTETGAVWQGSFCGFAE